MQNLPRINIIQVKLQECVKGGGSHSFFFTFFRKLPEDNQSDTYPPLVTEIVDYVTWFGKGENDPVKETAQLISKLREFLQTVWLLKDLIHMIIIGTINYNAY
jgi:hypothetical protein